ncbi:hypothetical protein J14TS2_05180 [Bacillus sp. J14TS2]|nr:hypothetical protein J14TS2_05180 [Bacillus sp. J14TS2]
MIENLTKTRIWNRRKDIKQMSYEPQGLFHHILQASTFLSLKEQNPKCTCELLISGLISLKSS